jgi:hypothetical protein
MELVKFDKEGGVVSFKVTVTGLVAWRYVYVADNYKFSKTNQDPPPYEHALGLPSEINNEINTWDFQLGNLSTASATYTVEITWWQDGKQLREPWSRKGTLAPPQNAINVPDSAMLVGV